MCNQLKLFFSLKVPTNPLFWHVESAYRRNSANELFGLKWSDMENESFPMEKI